MIFMIGFQAKVVVELLDTLLENGIPANRIGWFTMMYILYSLLKCTIVYWSILWYAIVYCGMLQCAIVHCVIQRFNVLYLSVVQE